MICKKRLMINTMLLTCSSLVMSAVSMAFQAYLAGKIGSAGIGLYSLAMTAAALGATVAVSGVRYAATRLVAEEICANGSSGGAVRRCLCYALAFGSLAMGILYLAAEPVGFLWIGDARTVKPLKIMAFSMPMIAVSSAISGYFTACGRVLGVTLVHFIEQLCTIALAVLFLSLVPAGNLEQSCIALTAATLGGDAVSVVLISALYVYDKSRHGVPGAGQRLTGRMLRLALPLAVSTYARSALSTAEHMLVPRMLRVAGYTADTALARYGAVHGMAMPVLSFPACILSAFAELIVPELTAAQVRGDGDGIRRAAREILKKGGGYSTAAALVIFIFADKIGIGLYSSPDAAHCLGLLAPLVPVMYCDLLCDGCLKGLGRQVWSMGVNILDALCGVVLVVILLPRYGMAGYIAMIYITECLNFALSAAYLHALVAEA